MNVSLPPRMKRWVETQVRSGRYANASDYVRDLIRHDQQRRRAVVEALIARGPGGAGARAVEDIVAAEPALFGEEAAPFWESAGLDDLIERQNVAPVEDFDDLGAPWPADEGFDDALAELLQDRRARREVHGRKAG